MEIGNNLRIFCITATFENRKIIIETIASNYVLEKKENRHFRKVVIEIINSKERNTRRALPIFVTKIYRTTSMSLINGPQVQRFVQEILSVFKSWVDQNKKQIDICDQHLEKILRKVYPVRQVECNKGSQLKIDQKIKGINDDKGETQKEEENITQNDRKTENETHEFDFRIHEHNRNDEEHEQNKEDTEIKTVIKKTNQTKERKKLKRMKKS